MAKNVKKTGIFDDLVPPTTGGQPVYDDVPTPTHTHNHTQKKERKTRRVQLLLKQSTVDNLDMYAKTRDISRNDLIQTIVDEFLARGE